jgi:hypothetical protein
MPKLTDRFLGALEIEEGRKDRMVFDTACPGLGVRMTAKGTRTFIAQWTDPVSKRKVREPLGVWGNLTIEQAREAVRARLARSLKASIRKPSANKSGTKSSGIGQRQP